MSAEFKQCGCGGKVEFGVGCLKYSGSDDHEQDCQHEVFMRAGGLGFGTPLSTKDAMMSWHLQDNGYTYEEAEEVIR